MRVFLGGTVADSTWRQELIPLLEVDYYNPIVEDWNEAAYQQEIYEREHCDFNIYVLTPKMIGYYSIAEVMDDAVKKGNRTIYCFLRQDGDKEFDEAQIVSLEIIGKRVTKYDAVWARSLKEVALFLNYLNKTGRDNKSNEQLKEEIDYLTAHSKLSEATERWWQSDQDKQLLWSGSELRKGLVAWQKLKSFHGEGLPEISSPMEQFIQGSKQNNALTRTPSAFISYARNPSKELAETLFDLLKADYDVWFDKVSIPHGEDFEVAIEKGIRECDNFLYVITDKSVRSKYCSIELDWAKRYGKRVIPIQHEPGVDEKLIDQDISKINRILLGGLERTSWDLGSLRNQIEKVTEKHSDLIQTHTNVLVRSVEWSQNNNDPRELLYGESLEETQSWLHDFEIEKPETNAITSYHQGYLSESRAFNDLGFREFWIAGEHEKAREVIEASFTINTDPVQAHPETLLKSVYFLFTVTKGSIEHGPYLSQLETARQHTIPIFFLIVEQVELPEALAPRADERVIDISGGIENEEIEKLKRDITIEVGREFRFFKTPIFLTYLAHSWSKKNESVSTLLRGRALSYFEYYEQTYQLQLSEKTRRYFEACQRQQDHAPYDIFLSRKADKRNFAYWLSNRLFEQDLTSWNHHDYLIEGQKDEEEFIAEGIEQSQNFVIVLSGRDRVSEDENIMKQLQLAQHLKKRIFVIYNETIKIPEYLSEYARIDFTHNPQQASFELINKLTTDREFIRFFNDLYPTALRWADSHEKMKRDLLLSGFPLENALNSVKEHKQALPEIFTAFLGASSKEEQMKKRRADFIRLAIVALAVFASVLAIYASFNGYEARQESLSARISKIEANIGQIEAIQAREETERQRFLAEAQRRTAERKTIQADSLLEVAICEKLKADESALLAAIRRAEAEKAEEAAEEARRNSDNLKRAARRENRIARSLLNAYEVRNTESKLMSDLSLTKAISSYYFHKIDSGERKHLPDIFTALFKVLVADGNGTKQRAIKNLAPSMGIDGYYPYGMTYSSEHDLFYILASNGADLKINRRNLQNPMGENIIPNQSRLLTAASTNRHYLWAVNDDGFGKLDLQSNVFQLIDSVDNNIRKLAVAKIGDAQEVIATRSRKVLTLYMVDQGIVQKIIPLDNTGPTPFPEAMALQSLGSGYLLSYALGDSVVTLRAKGSAAPNPDNALTKSMVSADRNDVITSLDVQGFKLAIGTVSGKIAVDEWLGRSKIRPRQKTKSSIREIVLDEQNRFYAGTTYGNQFEKSKMILNTLIKEQDTTSNIGIGHIERTTDDFISQIKIIDNKLFYLENNRFIKYHSLLAEDLITETCELLQNCESDSVKFLKEYDQEISEGHMQTTDIEYCSCDD